MKKRLEEYCANNTDRFYARWLCNRDPDLWADVLDYTSFLPDDALPRQRVWHALNENQTRPTCPVTGELVIWYENRYLTYFSLSAKSRCPKVREKHNRTYKERTGFETPWKDPDVTARRNATFHATKKAGKHKKPGPWTESRRKKVQETWMKKLGGKDPADLKYYRKKVVRYTKWVYKIHKDRIETNGLPRSNDNHLDHIYSICDGFLNNIPAYIIAHWTNLRVISRKDNLIKHAKSEKTLEQLIEDYESAPDVALFDKMRS